MSIVSVQVDQPGQLSAGIQRAMFQWPDYSDCDAKVWMGGVLVWNPVCWALMESCPANDEESSQHSVCCGVGAGQSLCPAQIFWAGGVVRYRAGNYLYWRQVVQKRSRAGSVH